MPAPPCSVVDGRLARALLDGRGDANAGYLLKDAPRDELIRAVRVAYAGKSAGRSAGPSTWCRAIAGLQTQRYRGMSSDACAAPASGTSEVSP